MDLPVNSAFSIQTYTVEDLPSTHEIEQLYEAVSRPPPLSEPPEVAQSFGRLYGYARKRDDVVALGAFSNDELVGFAYGHPWRWNSEVDPWSQELRFRLGQNPAELIDGSFAVLLLAVHPSAARRGLGAALLGSLMQASAAETHWLHTTDSDTPAQRLYRHSGYTTLGHGPDAPDERPGLVLVHTAGSAR